MKNDQEIKQKYVELPNEQVKILCSYTTRKEGFLDILLSKTLMSSKEVNKLFGTVKTHRGTSMTYRGEESMYNQNDEISFSTGFVSFKYSDPDISKREDYVGGFGVIVPLKHILSHSQVGFSHSSQAGGIEYYNLNHNNIVTAFHKARKEKELYDDGFGNLFEVGLWPEFDKLTGVDRKTLTYPRLPLDENVVVAIPESEKETIFQALNKRQEIYKQYLKKANKFNVEDLRWKHIDGRDCYYPKESIPFMEQLIQPIDVDKLHIFWYPHKNLDVALQYLSINEPLT